MGAATKWVTLLALAAVACGTESASELTASSDSDAAKHHLQIVLFPPWTPVGLPFLPVAINDAGLIAGNQAGAAVLYDSSTGVLAALPQPPARTTGDYAAVDVSSTGAVLGRNRYERFAGAIWQSGSSSPLLIGIPPVGYNFVPNAISAGGQVVGSAPDAGVAYRWSGGFTALPLPATLRGNYAEATDVNDAGYVVGVAFSFSSQIVHVILWSPSGAATRLASLYDLKDRPRIRNAGDVFWSDRNGVVHRWSGGTYSQPVMPPGFESLTGVSEAGRLIGTLVVSGARRGWTSFQGSVSFLDPPVAQPGDYFVPAGVDTCGDIVGVVYRAPTATTSGLRFSKYFPPCDLQPVMQ